MAIEAHISGDNQLSAEVKPSEDDISASVSEGASITAQVKESTDISANVKAKRNLQAQVAGSGGDVLSVNGMVGHVTLNATDVHALPEDYTPPVTKVNNKTGNVTLNASDVGALPDTTDIPEKTSDLTNDSGFVNATGAAAAAPVQSVNGQTGAVTIDVPSGVAVQDDTPTGDELIWVDTDDDGSFHTIPEIDDDNVSSSDTWSSHKILDIFSKVGDIFMSTSSTSPAARFGGTWEQIQNCFLLAAGSSYAAGSTGGEATHTLTINEMPAHYHNLLGEFGASPNSSLSPWSSYTQLAGPDASSKVRSGASIEYSGGGQAHNNMPPYLAVYVWKRIA